MSPMMAPTTTEEVAEVVHDADRLHVTGCGTKAGFALPAPPDVIVLNTQGLQGIVEHDVPDQVVVVRAGTSIADLQAALAERQQCLPLPPVEAVGALAAGVPGTVGGLVMMGLPHGWEGSCGNVRDWVLGMTVVRADGRIARCGSKAVKNVAGYDTHRFLVGTRGTLAVVVEVILRVYPRRALPAHAPEGDGCPDPARAWIQRTSRTDIPALLGEVAGRPYRVDLTTSTLWTEGDGLPRFPDDWVVRAGAGRANLPDWDPVSLELMRRTKRALDPTDKLNPGGMGFAP